MHFNKYVLSSYIGKYNFMKYISFRKDKVLFLHNYKLIKIHRYITLIIVAKVHVCLINGTTFGGKMQ